MEHLKKDKVMPNVESMQFSMFNRIDNLRMHAIRAESGDFLNELNDEIYEFDKKLQNSLQEKFGDENLRKMLPEWHKLVGSTPEYSEVDLSAKEYISEQIEHFVSRMETKCGL